MFYVYWIFENETDNIYKHGYVGVTNNIKRRIFTEHFDRFEGCHWMVIFTGNMDQAFKLERLLRPVPNIGLNKATGGIQFGTYSPMTGRHHSPETIEKIRSSNMGKRKGCVSPMKGKTHSDEVKERLRISSSQRKHRPESKAKVSEALRKTVRKKETGDKISRAKTAYYDSKRAELDKFIASGNYIGEIKGYSYTKHSMETFAKSDVDLACIEDDR